MKTITLPVSELKGVQLDWAFARALGWEEENLKIENGSAYCKFPDDFWDRTGVLMNTSIRFLVENKIDLVHEVNGSVSASMLLFDFEHNDIDALTAIGRCYIASKLGESVEVPILGDQ